MIGAGTLSAEWVVVRYKGEDQINLANWELRDEDRNVFVFPQLVLHKNGAVQVHTASGTNTVIDLYWSASDPVWEFGEEAQLFDPSGNLRAVYKVSCRVDGYSTLTSCACVIRHYRRSPNGSRQAGLSTIN